MSELPSIPVLLLIIIGGIMVTLCILRIDSKESTGQPSSHEKVGTAIGVLILIVGLFGMTQESNYRDDVVTYILDIREYHHSKKIVKRDQRANKHDLRAWKRSRYQYRHLPKLQFHNPQLNSMTLNQFNTFLTKRRQLRKQVMANKKRFMADPTGVTKNFNDWLNIKHARKKMNHEKHKLFVRHSAEDKHLLAKYKHTDTESLELDQ